MRKHINTFSTGINQDISTNKYPNTSFYWAENFRLISKDGLATGALTNVDGTLPKLGVGGGQSIVGMCLIRDTLVMFVASAEGGKIMIWDYNSNDFEESPTLIYHDANLNFSSDKPVRAVGRYETADIQKVYFTDGETFFKFLNIIPEEGEGYPLDYTVESLDLVADVDFSDISLELTTGGDLKAGKIQYAYQLYSKRGSESVFSPASDLIHLTNSSASGNSELYKGEEVGTSVNKSVNVSISNVDPGNRDIFTRLRLVALEYSVIDQIPNVRIVGEYNIEDKTSLTVTDTGRSLGELTLEEFRFIQNDFYPKTIDIKNDYLFAANISNNYFHITDAEFDARTFRFNDTPVCNVYEGNNVVPVSSDWSNLPAYDSEAYNTFNDWTNDYTGETGSVTTDHYKYKSDGVTLGGEGPNISYEFTTNRVLLDSVSTTTFTRSTKSIPKNNIGVDGVFENYASPSTPVGYKRDEIYRFGIIFIDEKGRESFVKWIGDIRFPSNKDLPFIHYDSAVDANKVYADILGIKFTVDTTSIKDKISGYRIVRAERTSSDRTIVSQGVIASMVDGGKKLDADDAGHMYSLATVPYVSDCLSEQVVNARAAEDSAVSEPQYFTENNSSKPSILTNEYMEFVSPEIAFNKSNYSTSNAYLELEGYLSDQLSTAITGPTTESNDWLVSILSDKYRSFTGAPDWKYRKDVTFYKVYTPKSISNSTGDAGSDATIDILDGGSTIFNNQATTNTFTDTRWGMRGTFALCKTEDGFPIPTANIPWMGTEGGGYDPRIFLGNYRIDKGRALYGGSTYEARQSTTYYPVSEFVDEDTTQVTVYGGDTYINYFWYMRSMWDNDRVDSSESTAYTTDDIVESVLLVPVESSINLDLRLDQPEKYMNWAFIRGDSWEPQYKLMEDASIGTLTFGLDYPSEMGNMYRYNSAYSAIDKSKEYYAEPFDFSQTLVNDTRILASEKKINGEYIDNWTKFKFNNYIDVDSKHNEIVKLITFKNNLFYFQPTAVGIASVNDRSLIQDNQAGQLTLGTGGILPRYDYVTDKSGSEYYDAILASDDYLYYADGRRKRINKLVPGKEVAVSVVKGIDSTLDKLAWENVRAGFDRGYNEVVFAIDDTTLAFSESADAFVSSYSFNPGQMISIGKDFFSVAEEEDETPWLYNDIETSVVSYSDDVDNDYIIIGPSSTGETLYKHNSGDPGVFYGGDGTGEDSYITLIINPAGNTVCFFDNLDLRTESTTSGTDDPDDIFYRLEASNNYQEITRELTFNLSATETTGTIKRIGRIWRTPIMATPPSGSSYSRMMDTYLKVTLRYSNTGNKFRVHDIITYYRPTKH